MSPGVPPQGKPNINTRRLVVEEGGFLYDSDYYGDDLPFWNMDYGRPHLVRGRMDLIECSFSSSLDVPLMLSVVTVVAA